MRAQFAENHLELVNKLGILPFSELHENGMIFLFKKCARGLASASFISFFSDLSSVSFPLGHQSLLLRVPAAVLGGQPSASVQVSARLKSRWTSPVSYIGTSPVGLDDRRRSTRATKKGPVARNHGRTKKVARCFLRQYQWLECEGRREIWLGIPLVLGVRKFWDVDWATVGGRTFVFSA